MGRRRHEAACAQLLMENKEERLSLLKKRKAGADRDDGREELSLPSLSLDGCLHLYSDVPIFQPLSTNVLCTKEVFLVSSLSMSLTLLQDQLHNLQGPMERKT